MRMYLNAMALVIGLLLSFNLAAQKKVPAAPSETYSTDLYSGMKWRCIGPYQGGRSLTASGVIGDPLTYYMGATGGGVWKTIDGGVTWFSVSDSSFTSSSVGALAVAPSDANVIYVGMGEAAIRNTAIMGDGIYKSEDAGKSWKHMLKLDAAATGRIIVHPDNPDVAYAAIMGKMFGTSKERGVFRTTDGGKTWNNILFKNDSTGAIDIDFDPTNPKIIYASLWQANRKPWKLESGGKGSGLYKSTDGGNTWSLLSENPGMPKGLLGKICLTVSATNPNRLYAIVESKNSRVYRSDDAGKTWSQASSQNDLTQRPWYFCELFCDPNNEDVVYVCNVEFFKSIDGGMNFSIIHQEHGDCHDVWINPDNSDNYIVAYDGSTVITFNGGKAWTEMDIPTAQMYHVNLDDDFPYNAYGGQQDWGSIRIATRSYGSTIGTNNWYNAAGGEAGYIVPQPGDPLVTYGGEYDGIMSTQDKRNEQYKFISVYPLINDGWGGDTWKYRFAWTFPISISPWNKDVLYCASNYLHRSTNRGMSWETISPDLTRNDPTKQLQSGGPITPDNTGAEIYCTIYAFAESSIQKGLFWAGTDDGLVHYSSDEGKTWNKITPPQLPEWATVSIIEPSHFDAGTCYFAAHKYRVDDTSPYIFKTTDFGKTWTKIVTGLPGNVYVRCVREDPNRKGLLYAGTETGVFVSFNDGSTWQSLQLNLPNTPVHDLQIKMDLREMVVATHGRSFWVLDDLSPLYDMNQSLSKSSYHLFTPRTAIRMDGEQEAEDDDDHHKIQEGTNAPGGAIIYYYLDKKYEGEMQLAFYHENGDSIIAFSNKFDGHGEPFHKEEEITDYFLKSKKEDGKINSDKGMHRFVWNLRYPETTKIAEKYWAPWQLEGPKVVPGNYLVKWWNDSTLIATTNLKVELNPKVVVQAGDLEAQFDLDKAVYDQQDLLIKKILQIRGVENQLNTFFESFADSTEISDLKKLAQPLLDSLKLIQDTLINSKIVAYEDVLRYPMQMLERYGALRDFIMSSDSRPAIQMKEVLDELNERLAPELKRLDRVFEVQIPEINRAIEQKMLKVIDPRRAVKKE